MIYNLAVVDNEVRPSRSSGEYTVTLGPAINDFQIAVFLIASQYG
jgi:hypothetical protein